MFKYPLKIFSSMEEVEDRGKEWLEEGSWEGGGGWDTKHRWRDLLYMEGETTGSNRMECKEGGTDACRSLGTGSV